MKIHDVGTFDATESVDRINKQQARITLVLWVVVKRPFSSMVNLHHHHHHHSTPPFRCFSESLYAIKTTADAAGTPAVKFTVNGDGDVATTSTTISISPTTGSIKTAGGVGVAQQVYVGGVLYVGGGGGTTNPMPSTSPLHGAVVVAGGVGIAKDLYVGLYDVPGVGFSCVPSHTDPIMNIHARITLNVAFYAFIRAVFLHVYLMCHYNDE
jgi:hypothetical protein